MPPDRAKLTSLESARGLAAMAIVAFHLCAIHTPLPDGPLRSVVNSLSGSVPIFFALSAFSLLYGYEATIFSREGLTRFFVRRAFRILPLFYFMLLVYVLRTSWEGAYLSKSELLINIAFLFPFIPGKHESLVWAGWSLGVEGIFYILFPLVALAATRLRLSLVLFVVFGLLSVAMSRLVHDANLASSFKSMNFGANLIHFQAGVVVFAWAAHSRTCETPAAWLASGRSVALASLCVLLAWFVLVRVAGVAPPGALQVPTALLTACFALAVVMLAFGGLPRVIDNHWSQQLGRHSYGIYLVHPFVLWLLSHFEVYQGLNRMLGDPTAVFWVALALNFAIVVPAAALSFRLIERPGMRFGDSLLNRMQRS